MRYIWEGGESRRRVMHIQRHNCLGHPLMEALCGIDKRFNKSINAPFALGKKVCKRCWEVAINET